MLKYLEELKSYAWATLKTFPEAIFMFFLYLVSRLCIESIFTDPRHAHSSSLYAPSDQEGEVLWLFRWRLRKEIKKKCVKILADCVALTIKDTVLLMLPCSPPYQMDV